MIDRGPLLISECSLTISNAGWIGKHQARRDRRCRRSIGVGIPRYQAFLLQDLGLVLSIFHSIGRNPPINEERNHRLNRPRITERCVLELYSEISLEIDTNAGRIVEVFVDAHFRNSVPADHRSSPSSSRANFIGNRLNSVLSEQTNLRSRYDDNASRSAISKLNQISDT